MKEITIRKGHTYIKILEINMFVDVSGVQIIFIFFLTRDMQVLVSKDTSHFIQLLHHSGEKTQLLGRLTTVN